MSLDELLETAYRRGTGVSRRHALSTARFRALSKEQSPAFHATAAEWAEIQYLGERLADKAFRNLPKDIRDDTVLWHEMPRILQLELLNRMLNALNTPEWARLRGIEENYEPELDSASTVLPKEYGSWTEGPVQPSCLGLMQMMIGFARAVDAPHLMLNVIVRSDIAGEHFTFRAFDLLKRSLEPYEGRPVVKSMQHIADNCAKGALKQISEVYQGHQAHHALIIKLAGGHWYVLDPYMRMLERAFNVEDSSDMFDADVYPSLMKEPARLALMGSDQDIIGSEEDFDVLHELFLQLMDIKDGSVARVQWILTRFRNRLVGNHDKQMALAVERVIWMGGEIQKLEYNEQATFDKREIAARKKHLRVNKRDRDRMYRRAMRQMFFFLSYFVYGLAKPALHPSVEVVHPSVSLGIATLHHLATTNGTVEPQILRFTRSQFILRDVLNEPLTWDASMREILIDQLFELRRLLKGKTPLLSLAELKIHL